MNIPEKENEKLPFEFVPCNVVFSVFPKFPTLSMTPVSSKIQGGLVE